MYCPPLQWCLCSGHPPSTLAGQWSQPRLTAPTPREVGEWQGQPCVEGQRRRGTGGGGGLPRVCPRAPASVWARSGLGLPRARDTESWTHGPLQAAMLLPGSSKWACGVQWWPNRHGPGHRELARVATRQRGPSVLWKHYLGPGLSTPNRSRATQSPRTELLRSHHTPPLGQLPVTHPCPVGTRAS